MTSLPDAVTLTNAPAGPPGLLQRLRVVAGRRSVLFYQLALLALLFVTWEVLGRIYPGLLSGPLAVLGAFADLLQRGKLLPAVGISLRTLIVGWILATLLGVLLGLLLGRFNRLALMFEPFLSALYSTPRIALVPLMVLWFGLNMKAMVATVVLLTIFPVLIMTLTGVRNAGREYLEIARSYCMSERAILFKVILPGALPYIGTGLRLASARAVTGVFVAELYIHAEGIGELLQAAEVALALDQVFAVTITISIIAIVAYVLVEVVEQRLQYGQPKAFE